MLRKVNVSWLTWIPISVVEYVAHSERMTVCSAGLLCVTYTYIYLASMIIYTRQLQRLDGNNSGSI